MMMMMMVMMMLASPWLGDLLVAVSGHRETTVPKLIANCFAEIQN